MRADCDQLSWRTGTEPIYRPPLRRQAAEGVVFVCFEEARVGERGGVQKVVLRGEFSLVRAGVFVLM